MRRQRPSPGAAEGLPPGAEKILARGLRVAGTLAAFGVRGLGPAAGRAAGFRHLHPPSTSIAMTEMRPQLPADAPVSPALREALDYWLVSAGPAEHAWLAGFLAGVSSAGGGPSVSPAAGGAPAAGIPLTIAFATESGNAEGLAEEAANRARQRGFETTVTDLGEVDPSDLEGAENLLLIASTWGEGDPPDRATGFYEKLIAEDAPRFESCRYSVLALGDTSYEHFCGFGKDLDRRMAELGAARILDRVDSDVDFEEPFHRWFEGTVEQLLAEVGAPASTESTATAAPPPSVQWAAAGSNVTTSAVAAPPVEPYTKKNPFPAPLVEKVNLNGPGSAKETLHLEFSLEGSGLTYTPGDAVGVYPENCPLYVSELLRVTGLEGEQRVRLADGKMPLREALLRHLDITSLSKPILEKYQEKAESAELARLLDSEHREELQEWLWGRELVDLLEQYPLPGMAEQDLVDLLRKLPPRLYSISSSPLAHPEQVHLTVAAVRYHSHGRPRKGVCSTYLGDLLELGDTAPVYFQENKKFRLPEDPDTPIIMVGPGTGIAPFRAFLEERDLTGAKGQNWLFFGDQHFQTDFLYQAEWQDYLKRGPLTRMDVAFSRDGEQKIYVQHRMRERARDLYAWLEEGAYFYVCGDASRMAKDVATALQEVVRDQGDLSDEEAADYVKRLKKEKRYQQDVY